MSDSAQPTRSFSIRRSFLLAIALLYALTVAATLVVFVRASREVEGEYVRRFAVARSLLERSRLLSVINRDSALSLKLADDPLVKAWMRDEDDPEVRSAAIVQLESYRRVFRDRSYFVGVAETLSYYMHSPDTDGLSHTYMSPSNAYDRWFIETLASDRDFWINVDYNEVVDDILVWINTLVRDSDGTRLGAVGTGMDLRGFLQTIVAGEQGIVTVMTNSSGHILAHPEQTLVESNAMATTDDARMGVLELIPDPAEREQISRHFEQLRNRYRGSPNSQGDDVAVVSVRMNDLPYTLAIGYIGELDWYSMIFVEARRVIAMSSFYPLLAIVVTSLLAVSGVLLYLLNRLVLAPLKRLDAAARRVSDGDYRIALILGRDDELGRVGQSFVAMTDRIRSYTGNLERMVRERTQELHESQERILESIRYGRLIQDSIMPSQQELAARLSECFIVHEPLDTVGGDFVFFRPTEGGYVIAVVDCTGHGVPGAFMTMLVNAGLNHIVEGGGVGQTTDTILQRLHAYVQDSLRGAENVEHLDNGFDIALCRYDERARTIEFSGAGLPLVHVTAGETVRVPGTRARLGFRSTPRDPEVERATISVEPGAAFYLFSDGVLDLPGGEHGHGLGNRRFLQIVESLAGEPPQRREESFRRAFDEYRGGRPRRDDLILVGFVPIAAASPASTRPTPELTESVDPTAPT